MLRRTMCHGQRTPVCACPHPATTWPGRVRACVGMLRQSDAELVPPSWLGTKKSTAHSLGGAHVGNTNAPLPGECRF